MTGPWAGHPEPEVAVNSNPGAQANSPGAQAINSSPELVPRRGGEGLQTPRLIQVIDKLLAQHGFRLCCPGVRQTKGTFSLHSRHTFSAADAIRGVGLQREVTRLAVGHEVEPEASVTDPIGCLMGPNLPGLRCRVGMGKNIHLGLAELKEEPFPNKGKGAPLNHGAASWTEYFINPSQESASLEKSGVSCLRWTQYFSPLHETRSAKGHTGLSIAGLILKFSIARMHTFTGMNGGRWNLSVLAESTEKPPLDNVDLASWLLASQGKFQSPGDIG